MLEKIRQDEFDQVFSLMERSFPPDEYRSYQEQKALLLKQNYEIYAAYANKEPSQKTAFARKSAGQREIRAFLAIWRFSDLTFIEHFAVDPAFRSSGLGSLVLTEVKQLFAHRICLEVELPENALAKRRVAFYERNGFFVNKYPYVQPPISEGKKEIPLLLMTSQGGVERECFARIKEQLYREVYGMADCADRF